LPDCWLRCRLDGFVAGLMASLPDCWLRCRLAGFVAGLMASLPDCWLRCRIAGFVAGLLASLPDCWLRCRIAGLEFSDYWLVVCILKVLRPITSTQVYSRFPCVYKQTLRRFPTFQVATTCFSRSPPDLNSVVTNFMFCLHVK
jgi:hypothetical protein